MFNMPTLKVRKIGNSLGILLPKEVVDQYEVRPGDDLQVDIRKAVRLEDVAGALKKYGLSPNEWNDLMNEGEEL